MAAREEKEAAVPEGRPPDDRDIAVEISRDLAELSSRLSAVKGEVYNWLASPEYLPLRHRIEAAHAAVEAAAVEARRRVRLNEGR